MWKQVVVSNPNDAVGGDCGCGKRIVVSNTNDPVREKMKKRWWWW